MGLSLRQLDAFFADEMEYGQLCDIVVPRASVDCWAEFLRVVADHYPYEFYDGESTAPIPDDPRSLLVFVDGEALSLGLTFVVEGLTMRALFVTTSLIEVDTPRRDIQREHYEPLQDLMRRIGTALERDVFMTPESNAAEAVLAYEWRHRRFRAPHHGGGTDGRLKTELLAALRPFLKAILQRSESVSPCPPVNLEHTLNAIERAIDAYDELALQDHLTIDERRDIDNLWSSLATLVRMEQEGRSANFRASSERDLTRHAAHLLLM